MGRASDVWCMYIVLGRDAKGQKAWYLKEDISAFSNEKNIPFNGFPDSKAHIPQERKIPGVRGWRWAMPPTPEFCVGI